MSIKSYFKDLIKRFFGLIMIVFGKGILRKSLVVICYHDINENPSEFSKLNSLDLNPDLFRKQLLFLKSNFNIISPDDLTSGNIPERAVLITFDDGWRSTFEVAIPKCLIKASGENKDKLTKIINKSFNDTPMDGNRAYFNI